MAEFTRLQTREGSFVRVARADVESLAHTLDGRLLRLGDPGYDEARVLWNAMIDRRPGLIACCASRNDVVATIAFVRRHDLLVSVKGGGHNVAGHAVCEGGVVIDLSPMQDVDVDPLARTVRVQPGVVWATLDRATQAHGLATTGGTVSHTGVAGLTLGGGLGWMMAKHGLSCDNLLRAEVVTANGDVLMASETENAELFWALRGGGGNFGIVTSFEFRLHEVGPNVLAGLRLYPFEQATEVLRFYRDFSARSSSDLTAFAVVMTPPGGPKGIAIAAAWFGDPDVGNGVLAPLRAFGEPLADLLGPMPYLQLQTMFDAAVPPGLSRYWKAGYVQSLDDALIDILVERAAGLSPLSAMLLFHMHGAASRVAADATAFAWRRDQWDIDILSQWVDPADSMAQIEATRRSWEAIAPFSSGAYLNHLDRDDQHSRLRQAFGVNYRRLSSVKRRYDPDNVFRHNSNIVPAG